MYVALLGVAELPAYTVTAPITDKVGRKPFIIGCFMLTALVEVTLVVLLLVGQGAGTGGVGPCIVGMGVGKVIGWPRVGPVL